MNKISESCPSNVGQAVQLLLYHLPFKDKVEVATKKENELPELQSTLGKFIHNQFCLEFNAGLIESCLPLTNDTAINSYDASLIIIKEFWKRLKPMPM
jgi:hypothetical protein